MKLSYRSVFALFTLFLLSVILTYFQYHEDSRSTPVPKPKQILNSYRYNNRSQPNSKSKPEAKQVHNFQDSMKIQNLLNAASESETLTPQCDNILETMTRGRWVKKVDLKQYANHIEAIIQQEENQMEEMKVFWMERGVQFAAYSEDSRCGYKHYKTQPAGSTWPKVGSWCDPSSERPCCSNNITGTCRTPSQETCNCSGFVDLRKYKYAESSDWIVEDENCKWRNYNASQICDVIERSPFQDIYYVGDSFMRKMFRTLSVMITDDLEYGGTGKSASPELREKCKGMRQYYYDECRGIIYDISQVYRTETLCGSRGLMNFHVRFNGFYNNDYKTHFSNLVKSKLGVNGSLIVLGVGAHMGCNFQSVIQHYLGPAIDVITQHYGSPTTRTNFRRLSGRWPQIVFCFPPQMGLLKPFDYLGSPSTESCINFANEMRRYAKQHDISLIHVRAITQFLHSFDGTHHAFGVNRLKNLILLNYIASLDG